jgi:amidase
LFADKEVDVYPSDFKALGEADEITKADYDPVAVDGIPISLQLTGRRLEDEKTMALTEKVCKDIS